MRLVGIWLRNVGRGLTHACELAAFDFWDLGVFVGLGFEAGGRGRTGGLVPRVQRCDEGGSECCGRPRPVTGGVGRD